MTFDAVLIAGPTASGKSAAALALAEQIGGVVINADSMQVYDGVPILTAQPSEEDRARVPHKLYGHVSPRVLYSVGRWRDDVIAEFRGLEGRIPIFVGGSGMYFTVLEKGLSEIPPIPDAVRNAARSLLAEIGVEELHRCLAIRDPKTAETLHPTDSQRTLRAWEVIEATGRPLVEWQNKPTEPLLKGLRIAAFVLDPPRPELRRRIAERFERMVDGGGLEEAMALTGLDPALPAAKLLGLQPLQALSAGTLTRDEALELAITGTRQFAKRQMTWFRHRMAHYTWFDPFCSNIITQYSQVSS